VTEVTMADDDGTMVETFVAVTDDLVAGVDVDAYLRRLVAFAAKLLDVRAVAVLFAGGGGGVLDVVSSSGELADLIARCEVSLHEGPGVDSFRSGAPVECHELCVAEPRWPRFAPVAVHAGLAAAHAVPCRSRDDVLGTLTMYATRTGALSPVVAELSRAMANAVSLGVTTYRERGLAVRANQLQHALNSRVIIEQAKGMLAERLDLSIQEAFELLRAHARSHNAKVHDVARQILSGTLRLRKSPSTPPAGRTPRTPPPHHAG
jgi:ANTAR domain/GAF domain